MDRSMIALDAGSMLAMAHGMGTQRCNQLTHAYTCICKFILYISYMCSCNIYAHDVCAVCALNLQCAAMYIVCVHPVHH